MKEYLICRERGTKKKSESPTGIEPVTFRNTGWTL